MNSEFKKIPRIVINSQISLLEILIENTKDPNIITKKDFTILIKALSRSGCMNRKELAGAAGTKAENISRWLHENRSPSNSNRARSVMGIRSSMHDKIRKLEEELENMPA